jgi:thioredoxin-like negative regulator of GroEL
MGDAADMFPGSKVVKELKPSDFDEYQNFKLKSKECTAVFFYCHWCPHCRNLKETWEQYARTAAGLANVCAFNCEKYKGHILKMNEEKPGMVQGYPTIWFFKEGIPVKKYQDERTKEKLISASMAICRRK